MSIDNMNEAELQQALESEIQALNGGINPSDELSQEEIYAEEVEDTEMQDENVFEEVDDYIETDETDDEEVKENKSEKKIKKLLHQRNEERKEKESLVERITRLENELADNKFYESNKEALNHKDEISNLVKSKWLTRDEAYILIAGKQLLEQNKKLNSNKTSMIGNTPWINKNGIDPKNMNMSDLEALVKQQFSAGNINI